MQSSCIHLSKSAYRNNYRFLKKQIGRDVVFCSVIKGNAYGHGIEQFVPMAEDVGINYFAVFDTYEARRIQSVCGTTSDIMVMGFVHPDDLEWCIAKGISFFVYNFERLEAALSKARTLNKPARIHIEFETGLRRTGFESDQFSRLMELLRNNTNDYELEGLCTHFAGAESIANYLRVQQQIRNFDEMVSFFENEGFHPRYRHSACSAAAIAYPETRHDLVRFGIAQYGFWPSRETEIHYLRKEGVRLANPLRRLITWKSLIMSLKTVPSGEYVGYSMTYLSERDTHVATVPIGYSHGYSRSLSNQGRVLIHGKRMPVIGAINMNLMLVDVTDLKNVNVGDEVVMIGTQKKQSITVGSFADASNQLNYEMLTRLPSDIPREVV